MTLLLAPKPHCRCLTCRLERAVDEYYAENGERDPKTGKQIIDASEAISQLQTVAGRFVTALPERAQRRRALAFAHDALDAGARAARTGTAEYVTIPSVAEH